MEMALGNVLEPPEMMCKLCMYACLWRGPQSYLGSEVKSDLMVGATPTVGAPLASIAL